MKILATTAALLLLTWSFSASSDSGVEKTIGDDWRWFEDYALFYVPMLSSANQVVFAK